jgi:hypothetical protein
MRRGRPPLKALTLTSEAREELESLAHSRTLPHGHVRRAKIVLMCSDGLNNEAVAEKVGAQSAERRQVANPLRRARPDGLV